MAPVMGALFGLAVWADRLYAAFHFPQQYPPTTAADYTRAAVVFWFAALFPILVGLGTAVVAFRRKHAAIWPFVEMCIIAPLWLLSAANWLFNIQQRAPWYDKILFSCFLIFFFVFGGTIVTSMLNLGACVRHRKWGRFALSFFTFLGAALPAYWMYVVIIYFDG